MTPSYTKYSPNYFNLGNIKGRKVIADFTGGRIPSDAGIILLAELDRKLKITEQFAQCFQDYRESSSTYYSVHKLLAQRVYGIVLGYEDVNDHDKLRYDPALAIALEKLDFVNSKKTGLAGKSTINRLESRIDYVLAMATNSQLKLRSSDIIEKAKADYESRLEPVTKLMETLFSPDEELEEAKKLLPESTWYRSLCYKTQQSWSRSRRVVTKVCHGYHGSKMRHVVTSLPASKITPSLLYTDKYCPRGEMENRIKEQQLDLYGTTEPQHKPLTVIN